MIEPIMYFGIGFLVAGLFGLVLVPLVHNRATRLATRRLDAATPLSMAEIQADKDQLRAEFAMSTRRLEMSVEQLKTRSTSQLSELAKKTEAINRLKAELGDKTAAILALEAREKAMRDQLRATEQEYEVRTTGLHETERTLNDKAAALARLDAELNERTVLTESQRVEILSLRTQVEALKAQLDRNERDVRETEDRLFRERGEAEAATRQLAEARDKAETLGSRVAELERQLLVQTTEAELLGRRAHELEERLSEQGRLLVRREFEFSQLRDELAAARKTEADLREELAAADSRHAKATEGLRADKTRLEGELEQAREERVHFQREIAAMKRDVEASWASERVENALLRERINDIAVEISRLTVAIEGPNGAIDAVIADNPPLRSVTPLNGAAVNGVNGAHGEAHGSKAYGDLGDRIRALQAKASRLSPAS